MSVVIVVVVGWRSPYALVVGGRGCCRDLDVIRASAVFRVDEDSRSESSQQLKRCVQDVSSVLRRKWKKERRKDEEKMRRLEEK